MKTVFLLLLPLLLFSHAPASFAEDSGIYFIASTEELQNAFSMNDFPEILAISAVFYERFSVEAQVKELIKNFRSGSNRGVIIYGSRDPKVIESALGQKFSEYDNCGAPVVFGVFSTEKNGETREILLCVADENVYQPDAWYRDVIVSYWNATKETLKNDGYAISK